MARKLGCSCQPRSCFNRPHLPPIKRPLGFLRESGPGLFLAPSTDTVATAVAVLLSRLTVHSRNVGDNIAHPFGVVAAQLINFAREPTRV